jgi:hypothetical protein
VFNRKNLFCNETITVNEASLGSIINCYEGYLPKSQASFIPVKTTVPPVTTTTEKSLSFSANVHMFFLRIIGQSDILENTTTLKPKTISKVSQFATEKVWAPEAKTLPSII